MRRRPSRSRLLAGASYRDVEEMLPGSVGMLPAAVIGIYVSKRHSIPAARRFFNKP